MPGQQGGGTKPPQNAPTEPLPGEGEKDKDKKDEK